MEAKQLIQAALREDLGSGDITTQAIVKPSQMARAKIVAKQDLVLAGVGLVPEVFKMLDPKTKWKSYRKDGTFVRRGSVVGTLRGRAQAILEGERTALNFLQRLSGIATLTRQYVRALSRTRTKIYDTRKTTPGWRSLEKYAVRVGGGVNHRVGLYDRYLVKNNHIEMAGSVAAAIEKILRYRKKVALEVEVRNLKELKEALRYPIDLVLLDNFSPRQLERALRLRAGREGRKVLFEASGGIDLQNIKDYAKAGVDFISVGALTHSAPAVDFHLVIT